jgi:flagellar basal-body rod modification protein FlgD
VINNVASGASPQPAPSLLASGPGGKMGKDEFIKLLLAQMRHQDPLNPMKGEELAVQLAQFSSVEQLMNLNAAVARQEGVQGAIVDALNGNSALSTIGRTVTAIGNQVVVPESSSVDVVVGGSGGEATLRILDASGKEVGTRPLGVLAGGRQSIELGSLADTLPPGAYTYSVEVRDSSGKPVPVQTFVTGRVDGVRYGSAGPVVTAGPLQIPIGSIVEIVAPK